MIDDVDEEYKTSQTRSDQRDIARALYCIAIELRRQNDIAEKHNQIIEIPVAKQFDLPE